MLKQFFLIFFFLAVTAHSVRADHEDIVSEHTMETADKKYLFVMLKGGTPSNPFVPTQTDKYPQSGLYLNDGSNTPLWTVDWCANVLLPADGIHIVRKGRHTLPIEFNEEVITFLADGKELKSYRVSDLVQFPRLLPASSNYYEWQKVISVDAGATPFTINIGESKNFPYPAGVIFDEVAHTMHLETNQGDSYVFDLNTGEIISAHRPVRFVFLTLMISCLLLYLFYLFRTTGRPRKAFTQRLVYVLFSAFMIGFLIAATEVIFGDTLAEWASNYENSGFVSNFFYTLLFYFPYKTVDDFCWETIQGPRYYGIDLYSTKIFCFWFSISFIIGLLNYSLVFFVTLFRKRLFKNMKTAVATLLLITILFTSSAYCLFEQMS